MISLSTTIVNITNKPCPKKSFNAHLLLTLQATSGNILDSSAPAKRGKEREVPKSKKPSPLKKVSNPTIQYMFDYIAIDRNMNDIRCNPFMTATFQTFIIHLCTTGYIKGAGGEEAYSIIG